MEDTRKALANEFMRTDLFSFVRGMDIPGVPLRPLDDAAGFICCHLTDFSAHHRLWLEKLQQVENGEIKRLMGLMPPGSAKSTYTSVVLPVHVMGRSKGTEVLVASYGSVLPRRWRRKARSIVKQWKYQAVSMPAGDRQPGRTDQRLRIHGRRHSFRHPATEPTASSGTT
jgi:hypothetical protein